MFDLVDLIIVATLSVALSGLCWMTGFWLYSRRPQDKFTVVLYLPEHDGDPTVHFVTSVNPDDALRDAAAEKLGSSLRDAQVHLETKPYDAFVFDGHQRLHSY